MKQHLSEICSAAKTSAHFRCPQQAVFSTKTASARTGLLPPLLPIPQQSTGREEAWRNSLSSSLLSFSVEAITSLFVLTNWEHGAQLILPKLNVLLAGKIHFETRCSEKIGY